MHRVSVIVLIASLAFCAADVSHLSLSRGYLPPLSGAAGYSAYSSYPSYTGSGYSSGRYYSGSGLGTTYGSPLLSTGYNSYGSVPQYNSYNSYVAPSRAYLPALTGYGNSGYSGLDTKYGANGGYVY